MITAMNTVNEAKPDPPRSSSDITDWTSVVRQLAKQAKQRSKIFYRRVKHTLLSPPPNLHCRYPHVKHNAYYNVTTHGLQRPASVYPSTRNWKTRQHPRMMLCVHSREPPAKGPRGQTAYHCTYCPYSRVQHLPPCMFASRCLIKQVIYPSHG